MKAVVWRGTNDVRVESVPDPKILNPRDAIVRITTSAFPSVRQAISSSGMSLMTRASHSTVRRAGALATQWLNRWSRLQVTETR